MTNEEAEIYEAGIIMGLKIAKTLYPKSLVDSVEASKKAIDLIEVKPRKKYVKRYYKGKLIKKVKSEIYSQAMKKS